MSDRDSLINRLGHRDVTGFHGVPARQGPRHRTKIAVPPQGAVSEQSRRHGNRREARGPRTWGVPSNNFQYTDTLYGDERGAASASFNDEAFTASSRRKDRPSANIPPQRSAVAPPSFSIKGKARQTEQPTSQTSPNRQDCITLDSDEEKSRDTPPQRFGASQSNDGILGAASNSALTAKDRKRRQEINQHYVQDDDRPTINHKARPPGPIPLEQPSDSRLAAALRKLPVSARAPTNMARNSQTFRGQPDRGWSGMASRMKPKNPSVSNGPSGAARAISLEKDDSPEGASFERRRTAHHSDLSYARTAQLSGKSDDAVVHDEIPSIALQRLVVSDFWRTADNDTGQSLIAAFGKDRVDISHRGRENLFSIRYTDISVLECTRLDVRDFGLISISLKPNSFSVTQVQGRFRGFDPRSSAETSELLLVAQQDEPNLQAQRQLAQCWISRPVTDTRWLDKNASGIKMKVSDAVRAAPWPRGEPTSATEEVVVPPQDVATPTRPKRALILPGGTRETSPISTRPSRLSTSNVDDEDSPDPSRKAGRKAFDIWPASMDDISMNDKVLPEPNSPPLPKLLVPSKREVQPLTRTGTRSSTRLYANNPIVQYPFEGIGAVTLLESDLRRLDDGELLNDTVIEFALKLMHEDIRKRDPHLADSIYIFNTFFYKILSESKEMESCYNKVRKWTSKLDLFSKKYIVVPINEDLHWYLALIVNPCWILHEIKDDTAPLSLKHISKWRESADIEVDNGKDVLDAVDVTAEPRKPGKGSSSPEPEYVPESLESYFYDNAPASETGEAPTNAQATRSDIDATSPNGLQPESQSRLDRIFEDKLPDREQASSNAVRGSAMDVETMPSPGVDADSIRSSTPRQLPVRDLRTNLRSSNRPEPVGRKPTHIIFDDLNDSELPAQGNKPQDLGTGMGLSQQHQRRSSTTVEINIESPKKSRADHDAQQPRKRAKNWREELASSESLNSDKSFDTMDGEEIRRVGRGTLEGGGPSIMLDSGATSPLSTRSRTRIVPGDGRRDEPVVATSFYGRRRSRAEKDAVDEVELSDTRPRFVSRRTSSRLATPTASTSAATPLFVDLETPAPRDAQVDVDMCFVITLDSLGIQHKNVAKQLREYLWREARDKGHMRAASQAISEGQESDLNLKKPPSTFPEPYYIQSQVPQQPNFCDCGIYLLHYFDRFFSDPVQSLRLAIASAEARAGKAKSKWGSTPAEQDELLHWQAGTVHGKRQYWRARALELSVGWKEFQERREAERLLVSQTGEESEVSLKVEDEADLMEIEPQDARVSPEAAPQADPDIIAKLDTNDNEAAQVKAADTFDREQTSTVPSSVTAWETDPKSSAEQPERRYRTRGRRPRRSLYREDFSDAEAVAQTVHLVHDSDDDTPRRR